ncbi:MAG: tRNA (N(6)-L-threonylcarbamoyladenosine(37)-C(2))-methylthiotransferase MtaB [Roseburia sp.]|nr:tRNA (N(6)-L-threonylcarbamoyladenosine(37)-C(2))-methylthiotransferase MtaB [Roseburia sp.]
MNKKTVALHNLGCKVNAYETEAMQQMMIEAGFQIVDFSEKADIYIINTCSVTNMADRKSRQMLHRAKRRNPGGIVVAVGCYVQTSEAEARKDPAVDIVVGNNKKRELVDILLAYEEKRKVGETVLPIQSTREYENLSITKTGEHTRAFIKVQDGCNQFCSYCIIPYARGRVRSRRMAEVLLEVNALADHGYQEVVLTGIHLSSYGRDTGEELLDLIQETAKVQGIRRIRLGSLEPRIVTEEFARELSGIEKICPHFHLSLQSGCDATLERMNRKYTTAEYEESCHILRKYFEHPAITTDVIVGFPGESEGEFLQTTAYLEKIHFYEMHVFKYSRRQGTKAAEMKDQIPEPLKAQRSEELITLGEKMSEEFREYYLGRETEALMEEPFFLDGEKYYSGYTKEYVKTAVKADTDLSNTLVRGRITGRLLSGVYLLE